jgi:amidase
MPSGRRSAILDYLADRQEGGRRGSPRIAISTNPALPAKPSPQAFRAVDESAELLRSLGHRVFEYELAHPQLFNTFTPRWVAGIADDARERPIGLERRTRRMAAVGRLLHGRALRRAIAREAAVAARLNAVFADHDVVLTPTTAAPPPSAAHWQGTGALRTFVAGSPYVCYTPTWNYVGQPAASVPAGFDADGLPLAVQIAGPPNAEGTLISLAAQLESARPWASRRPV